MVLEIAVKFMRPEPRTAVELDVVPKLFHRRAVHDLYTVHVDSTQILTVATRDDNIAGKWLTEVLKSTSSNTKPLNPNPEFRPDSIFVGLIADMDYEVYGPGGLQDHPYELLTFCVGSHCLMYSLPWPDYPGTPKVVKAFFENPRVVVLGRDMAKVANKLKKTHGIEIRKAVDLNELAIRGMKRDDLDLGRYDLDRLAMTVLGKHFDVIRPEEKLYEWWTYEEGIYGQDSYDERLCDEKVKFSTLDTHLCLLIGTALAEAIHGARFSGATKKKKKATKRSQ
ncbi:putative ribonuclease H-like domain-containing protein [Rosa chinensis]|uniref:Putative ribonuclease H-like domain-containing protein n=1 Tax=Rosa chinensis TaxID=74649 RepID=A0A2P6QAY3_ROSCH|nr:putative ribonuclease H-like domain-containing protein [Rosa chinensis]